MSTKLPTPVIHSSKRRTTKFWRKQYGINVDNMHFIYARGVLPKHPSFMAAKLLVKGFDLTKAPFKSKREIAMQRLYALLAPDMAVPMARQRDENGKPMHVVIMRWVNGITPTVGHDTGKPVIPNEQQHREYGAMRLLDMLTNNSDRHGGNYVYSKEHLHPIDHEMSFYEPLPRPDKCEYSVGKLSHVQLRGALTMLNSIKANARQVARWLHLGFYCDPQHKTRGVVFNAAVVTEWVDNVRPFVISCLNRAEGSYDLSDW